MTEVPPRAAGDGKSVSDQQTHGGKDIQIGLTTNALNPQRCVSYIPRQMRKPEGPHGGKSGQTSQRRKPLSWKVKSISMSNLVLL